MSELSEIEDDWRVLRRGVSDRIPVTMNVGEAFSRLTASIWAFLKIEGDDDTFTVVITYAEGPNKALKYRVLIQGFKNKDNQELFDPVNQGGFHEDLETALEFVFSQVGTVFAKYLEGRLVEINQAEATLNTTKDIYRKLERNRQEMGMYNPFQEPLPFPEPVSSVAAAS